MVIYPLGPRPPAPEPTEPVKIHGKQVDISMFPGEGINASPFEARVMLDFTFPLGGGSGLIYGLIFQLGKWGYNVVKFNTSMNVSPVFTEYYQKTIEEKRKLEEQMKAGFASITAAISDYELLAHDVRKYKEYLNYFKDIEIAQSMLKEAKEKKDKKAIDEANEKLKRAKHVLKAMFVDLVDVHAGEGISMKTIAVRWPTIITDFMTLAEDYEDPKEIKEVLNVSMAEATILATKCKLFKEWLSFFYTTVKDRYQRLRSLEEARKKSIEEYRNALKPVIARYKEMVDIKQMDVTAYSRSPYFRPDTQAISSDTTTLWAWRPFVPPDVFRIPRESEDRISFKKAGFYNLAKYYLRGKTEEERKKEREKIIKEIMETEKKYGAVLGVASLSESPGDAGYLPPLPAIPIIDRPLVAIIRQIEEEYGVHITPKVILETIKDLANKFASPALGATEVSIGIRWPFSPYFVFVEMTIERTVIKLPNGGTVEDVFIFPLKTYNETQNIILGRMLELWAKEEKARRDIELLLGVQIESGNKYIKEEDIGKTDYPEVFLSEEEKKKMKEEEEKAKKEKIKMPKVGFTENIENIATEISNFLAKWGIVTKFFFPGPYEKLMNERMTKMMQLGPGYAYNTIAAYLKKAAGVPGEEPKVWI